MTWGDKVFGGDYINIKEAMREVQSDLFHRLGVCCNIEGLDWVDLEGQGRRVSCSYCEDKIEKC